ncbi:RNA 3'-terminal phosphate cyclase-like protein [Strongyloides ratti]|uniref:RNA 3'-terminal phosphate cyclase-like protein n=1 Tax=Strongyloides ratti TaxID=34506 RepID=A0A090KWU4_STRRB|nr:RNA 3'-terminal phosphate cyclase-like protein [Strongyloides ratti]CEF61896.1 RNA 3'-terminal phosphate cyclase-like protein [Strongyloides ratti]
MSEELQYSGINFFRQRLVYSLLSGRSVKIFDIRHKDENPGVKDFETQLLKLLDQITNGIKVTINVTGTVVHFQPGVLLGGNVTFDCGLSRCISYFLEVLVILAPFCKRPINAKLSGITNKYDELSCDAIRATWLPIFKKFILNDENLEIKVLKRGFYPLGGGFVTFKSPVTKNLRPITIEKVGKVCKIRGLSYTCRVNSSFANRMVDAAKEKLRGFIADVYITIDQRKGEAGGKSNGYGIFLTAETTDGVFYHGEAMSKEVQDGEVQLVPEDIGYAAAEKLLDEIFKGGASDCTASFLASTFMALTDRNASKFVYGTLTQYSVYSLRHLKDFFGITFNFSQKKIEDKELHDGCKEKLLGSCIGVGYTNLNRTIL